MNVRSTGLAVLFTAITTVCTAATSPEDGFNDVARDIQQRMSDMEQRIRSMEQQADEFSSARRIPGSSGSRGPAYYKAASRMLGCDESARPRRIWAQVVKLDVNGKVSLSISCGSGNGPEGYARAGSMNCNDGTITLTYPQGAAVPQNPAPPDYIKMFCE